MKRREIVALILAFGIGVWVGIWVAGDAGTPQTEAMAAVHR